VKKKSLLVWSLLLVAIILYLVTLQGGKKPGQAKAYECTIDYPVNGLDWTLEGEAKYEGGKLRIDGTLISDNGTVDIVILEDGGTFVYGTMKPVSNPADARWYDFSDAGLSWTDAFIGHLEKGEKIPGCRAVEDIPDEEFELPDDAVPEEIPPGGYYEYY
jgi:hypothetical protein